jgi:hypothetical protein
LEISYNSSSSSAKITKYFADPPKEKTYATKFHTSGGLLESKDEIVIATIKLDNDIQTIELRNVD